MADPHGVVLFVDDEMALLEEFTRVLEWDGHKVLSAGRVDTVLELIDVADKIDIAILDLQLPLEGSEKLPAILRGDGRELGQEIARYLRRKFPEVPIIFWSGSADQLKREHSEQLSNSYAYPKNVGPKFIQDIVNRIFSSADRRLRRKAFIVHGHAEDLLGDLVTWLEVEFDNIEPIVLRNERSGGATLIDKLENYALATELVIVLLTPDDTVLSSRQDVESQRARQNVIFEMGYFFGRLGRRSGNVVLLSRGAIELPSDISGMIPIDVSNGLAAASDEIRREVDRWG